MNQPSVTPGPVLVIGASGNIGYYVVRRLVEAGAEVRAAARNPARLTNHWGSDISAVTFDFADASTWAAAFDGVATAYLMRPPHISNISRDMEPALRAMEASGVRHVVLLSVMGAADMPWVPHAKIEAWLKASSMSWTFIRPSFFMENLSTTHAPAITHQHQLIVPAGGGKTSFVAATDVAAVTCAALLDPSRHRNTSWTPTGDTALSYYAAASILTDVLGRRIEYRRPGIPTYVTHARRDLDMPWPMLATTVAIYTVARLGRAAEVTDDVRTVTGRAPMPFREWARGHREAWEGAT